MKDDGRLGAFFFITCALTLFVYQGVFAVAYRINWWLGAMGFMSQNLPFKFGCAFVSFLLAACVVKFFAWLQSQPADPSKN